MNLELSPIFKDVDQEYISLLKPLFEQFECAAGTAVIEQGARADFLYLVESGSVEIFYKPYDAETITVTHVEADGLFGWSALIGSPKYTSSAVAIETLKALRIRGRDLRSLCKEYPEVGRVILDKLATAVSSRWMNAHEQVKAILENGMTYE